jgi:hypothetical protein
LTCTTPASSRGLLRQEEWARRTVIGLCYVALVHGALVGAGSATYAAIVLHSVEASLPPEILAGAVVLAVLVLSLHVVPTILVIRAMHSERVRAAME